MLTLISSDSFNRDSIRANCVAQNSCFGIVLDKKKKGMHVFRREAANESYDKWFDVPTGDVITLIKKSSDPFPYAISSDHIEFRGYTADAYTDDGVKSGSIGTAKTSDGTENAFLLSRFLEFGFEQFILTSREDDIVRIKKSAVESLRRRKTESIASLNGYIYGRNMHPSLNNKMEDFWFFPGVTVTELELKEKSEAVFFII